MTELTEQNQDQLENPIITKIIIDCDLVHRNIGTVKMEIFERNEPPSLSYLYGISCLFFDVSPNELDNPNNKRHHSKSAMVDARKMYCWLANLLHPNKTHEEVMLLTNRKRSMMTHYLDLARFHIKYDPIFRETYNKIAEHLKIEQWTQ